MCLSDHDNIQTKNKLRDCRVENKTNKTHSYLSDRLRVVLRLANVDKLDRSSLFIPCGCPCSKCVCELTPSGLLPSILIEPAREFDLSIAAISSKQLKNDCFWIVPEFIPPLQSFDGFFLVGFVVVAIWFFLFLWFLVQCVFLVIHSRVDVEGTGLFCLWFLLQKQEFIEANVI